MDSYKAQLQAFEKSANKKSILIASSVGIVAFLISWMLLGIVSGFIIGVLALLSAGYGATSYYANAFLLFAKQLQAEWEASQNKGTKIPQ